MNLNLYKFDELDQELERLQPFHRLAFAAACCERMLPNYNAFSRMENWGNPSILRIALDEVWHILQGKPVDAALIQQLIEDCEDAIPDSDEIGGFYDVEAQEAAIAICVTLETCLDPSVQQIIRVVNCVTNTIDAFVLERDKSFNESEVGLKKLQELIANHPLAVREMVKQSEDLQKLKETLSLNKHLIEWLHTSSNNNGKSLINLS